MRILFIHTKYKQSAGGEDAAVEAEISLMKSKGHEVETLFFDNGMMEPGWVGKMKAGISAVYNSESARKLKKTLQDMQPDIIHVHNFFFTASPSVLFEASRNKIPVVVTLHNFRLICSNALLLRDNKICELCIAHAFPWYGVKYKCYHDSALQSAMVGGMAAIHKWAGTWKNKVDQYITPGAFARSTLLRSSFNVPPEKIVVKPNFIDDPGASAGADRQDFYLFIGRISSEKGTHVALDAWSQLSDRRLVIAGDGPERQQLTEKYAGSTNITFVGKKSREEVLSLMKQCRALIFPSVWYEGLPMTIVEAFATGTPVIASNLGAMKEMIQHLKNGLLFEPKDTDQLAQSVVLLDSLVMEKNYTLYEQARETYLREYHPDKCYEITIQVYERLLAKKMASQQ